MSFALDIAALFGMLLAVIVPPGRKNRAVAALVALSVVAGYAASRTTPLAALLFLAPPGGEGGDA